MARSCSRATRLSIGPLLCVGRADPCRLPSGPPPALPCALTNTLTAIIGTLTAIIGTLIAIIGTLIAIIGTLISIIGTLVVFRVVRLLPCALTYQSLR